MASRAFPQQAITFGSAVALLRAARPGLVGIPIGLAAFALLCFAAWLSLGRDLPAARAQVTAAFQAGALQDAEYRAGDTQIGWHQYNDCLILWQALDQRASAGQLAVSPLLDPHREETSRCARLRAFADHGPAAAAPAPEFYHRYLHGHTMLVRFLLPILSVERIRLVYHLALTALVVAGLGLSLWGLARRRRPAEALFWLIVFLAFARWFGLESFGQSLGHGPADIVHLGFLLFLAAAGVRGGLGRRTALLACALFGAMVMSFEFLTGGLPLGLAAVIGGLPFAVRPDERQDLRRLLVAAATAFCTAAIACYAAKIVLAVAVFGPASFFDTALQLQMRAGLGSRAGETVEFVSAVKKLLKGFQGLAAGMPALAFAMTALAAAAGLWGTRIALRTGDAALRDRAAALLLSNLAIVALLVLLWQHTVIHAWFMHRTFAWTVATGLALFLLTALPPSEHAPAASARP